MIKKYLLDNIPVTPTELIREAEKFNERFAENCVKSTSDAARILRHEGFTVGVNPKVN